MAFFHQFSPQNPACTSPLPVPAKSPPPPTFILLAIVTSATLTMQLSTMQSPAVKAFGLHSGPNTFLSTLLSDNLTVTHQASYRIKSRQNYSPAYINLRSLLDSKLQEKCIAETEMKYKVTLVGGVY